MSKALAEELLERGRQELGVDTFSFYVRDPCWTGNLLMLLAPGAVIKEAVYSIRGGTAYIKSKLAPARPTELFFGNARMEDILRQGNSAEVKALIDNAAAGQSGGDRRYPG